MGYSSAFGTLEKPLTKKEVKEMMVDGRITVNVEVELDTLFDGIEAVNDLMDTLILKSGTLNDISYQVVGSIPPSPDTYIGGTVILRVNAEVEEF
jgi:hypothetical protein